MSVVNDKVHTHIRSGGSHHVSTCNIELHMACVVQFVCLFNFIVLHWLPLLECTLKVCIVCWSYYYCYLAATGFAKEAGPFALSLPLIWQVNRIPYFVLHVTMDSLQSVAPRGRAF